MPDPISPQLTSAAAWRVQQVRDGDQVKVVSVKPVASQPTADQVVLRTIPAILSEDAPPSKATFEDVVYRDKALPAAARAALAEDTGRRPWPGSEVRTLVSQGPVENRINLTVVGDGYTAEEKEKFFADVTRIKDELFSQTTFKSYLPLFNVHAVFVPSKESGLTDTTTKNTALGLYRSPEGSKRGVMPGDYSKIDKAIDLAPATDFPILMANDDFYGGLGGQYAITTRSPESGSMVLRHELGHNFGDVGEEYDGGMVYSGANHSDSPNVPWKQWVQGDAQAFKGKVLLGTYPWENLSKGPLQYRFEVPEHTPDNPQTVALEVSSVGWETPDDVAILLDGKPVEYKGVFTADRSFFKVQTEGDLKAGKHILRVEERVHDGDNVLAIIRANLYDGNYDFTPGKVEAFPTFDDYGSLTGYRPTHEDCLMRDMRSTEFCSVDKENMWSRFLSRVSLVDGVQQGSEDDGQGGQRRFVQIDAPALPGLDIHWFEVKHDGSEVERTDLAGQMRIFPAAEDKGLLRARLHFSSPEIRTPDARVDASVDVRLKPHGEAGADPS